MSKTKELSPEEKWNNATIANNFIFYKVMRHNKDICKELLEILLEIEIDHIELHGEELIQIDAEQRAVRLDVYARNSTQAFNIEMQTTNTKELSERARYYQGILDVECLNSGQPYKELKTSYIIFICIEDIFNKGLGKYTFQNVCREESDLTMNDRAFKYFFIAKNCDKLLNEKQRAFLNLVLGRPANGDFASRLSRLVNDAKHNEQWRLQYMTFERFQNEAFERGKDETRLETAKKLLQMNVCTIEQIASATALSIEEVKALAEEAKSN